MHSDVQLGSISWQYLDCEFVSDSLGLHEIFRLAPIAELIVLVALSLVLSAIVFPGFIDVLEGLAFIHLTVFHHWLRVNDFIRFGWHSHSFLLAPLILFVVLICLKWSQLAFILTLVVIKQVLSYQIIKKQQQAYLRLDLMVYLAIFPLKDFRGFHVHFFRRDDRFVIFMAVGLILQ